MPRQCGSLPALAFFVSVAFFESRHAGHLVAMVKIVDGAEDRVVVGNFDDRPVGKYLVHAGEEHAPLDVAVEIVAHEKAAAQQEFAHGLGLVVGQVPVAHFHAVEPRPIVHVVVVKIDGLFHGTRADARQAGGRPWKKWRSERG